jgi:signal peptide peptidase SppA
MSEHAARSALNRMNLREQFIAPHYNNLAADLHMMMMAKPDDMQAQFMEKTRHELCEAYGFSRREQNKPFAFANGFAIIPVHGTLLNRFGASYGYVTGYNFINAQHMAAMADDDVHTIIHDHNSYGGEAAGCFEQSARIAATRGKGKKIIAVVDSNCYSASFALASAADKIIAIPSAGVGSIGVVAMHVDMSKFLERVGVSVTFIHSGEHKVDGNPYEPLPKEVKADIQAGVDKSRAKFVKVVSENMGLDSKVVYDTEARTYRADDALAIGLIHAIAEPTVALQSLIDADSGNESAKTETTKEQSMEVKPEDKANGGTVDQAAVQKAERERVSGILNCEEAKGKSALAQHLALNTSMSVADAKAALSVASAEGAAAPSGKEGDKADGGDNTGKDKAEGDKKPDAKADANKPNQFSKAMDAEGGAGVGADAAANEAASQDRVASVLGSLAMATGQDFRKKA